MGYKGNLRDIFLGHFNLMIPWESIHKAKKEVTSRSIDELVNQGQRVGILRANPVWVCIVDIYALFPITLLYHNYIGQPLGVLNFTYEIYL